MKSISVREPWASMIRDGKKTIETRTWKTKYRGPLLLCASQKPKSDISGHAFAIANLVDIRPMTKEDEKLACCKVYNRALSWILKNVRLITPFPVKGKLSIYEVEYKGE